MKCLDDRINWWKSKDTVKSWFGKPGASGLQSVEPEGQERALVIKERSGVGTKKEQLFLRLCLERVLETG